MTTNCRVVGVVGKESVEVGSANSATIDVYYCFALRNNWFWYINNGECAMTCNETSFHGLELDALCVTTINCDVAACYQACCR